MTLKRTLPIPITALALREKGRIHSVEGPERDHLFGYGLYPGALVQIQQRFPSFVVKTDETELALEKEVANQILVIRLDS